MTCRQGEMQPLIPFGKTGDNVMFATICGDWS
jgi:hypothetical protein